MKRYNDSISYFTRAYNIDPENIHILIKRAITYYELQEYDKAFLDLDKSIQLNSLNSFVYYCKGLIYYALGNNTNAKIELENCKLFDSNDNLAKVLLNHLECLLHINNYKDNLLQENLDLQSYLFNYFEINDNDFNEFGIINKFNKLMYKSKRIFMFIIFYIIYTIIDILIFFCRKVCIFYYKPYKF